MGTDLVSALVQASKAYADPIAQAYASGNRPFTVRLSRPAAANTFDRTTMQMTNPVDEVLYEGPGRIRPASSGVELELGDERTSMSSARISIDDHQLVNGVKTPITAPRVDDVLEVLVTTQSSDTHMAGRTFTVTGVEVGGHFGIGYQLDLLGVAPSRRAP